MQKYINENPISMSNNEEVDYTGQLSVYREEETDDFILQVVNPDLGEDEENVVQIRIGLTQAIALWRFLEDEFKEIL